MSFNIPHINFTFLSKKPKQQAISLQKLNRDAKALLRIFQLFDKAVLCGKTISPGAQWLVDNYYIIDKTHQTIKRDLNKKLSKILSPILALCQNHLSSNNYNFSEKILYKIIRNNTNYISIEELWSIPLCLRIILLQKTALIALDLEQRAYMREMAHKISNNKTFRKYNKFLESEHFLVSFYYQLREEEENSAALAWLNSTGKNLNELAIILEERQANNAIFVANIIKSIKKIDDFNWHKWLENISPVDNYLSEHSEYNKLDRKSRNILRNKIVNIARYSNYNELEIAHKLIKTASDNKLIGYYLYDDGEAIFKKNCNYKANLSTKLQSFILKHNKFWLIFIMLLSALCFEVFTYYQSSCLRLCLIIIPIAFEFAFSVFNKITTKILPARLLLGYDFSLSIPIEHSSLVTIPCLFTNYENIDELLNNLTLNYLVSTKGNLFFALVADYIDSPSPNPVLYQQLRAYAQKRIDKLNDLYTTDEPKFFLFCRKLLFNQSENCYMGWERKRGKLYELNKLLRGDKTTSFLPPKEFIKYHIKYIITLDSDTRLAPNSACELIGKIAYELNQAQFDAKNENILKGYSILQPRITTLITAQKYSSLFQTIFARNSGLDPYISGISETYQDLCAQGTYIGKAIYNIDNFMRSRASKIKENTVLSHDLLEGSYAKCAFVSDIELLEEYPKNYLSEINRLERWTRGDWQLLSYMKLKQLDIISIVKMLDNLRRSLLTTSLILGLLSSIPGTILFGFFSASIFSFTANLFYHRNNYFSSYLYNAIRSLALLIFDNFIKLSLACHNAFYNLRAIITALYRITISHKNLLQWHSYQIINQHSIDFAKFFHAMKFSLLYPVLILLFNWHKFPLNIITILWLCAPLIAYFLSKYKKNTAFNALSKNQKIEFLEIGARIWRFYESFCNRENNFLPIDNFQEYDKAKIAHRTSPTNIGMYLLSIVAAHDLDWISLDTALTHIENCLNTIAKLKLYKGHLYNWYNTKSLEALPPLHISTVDSGNLGGHLLTLSAALKAWSIKDKNSKATQLGKQAKEFAYNMQFDFLLDKKRQLLSIGFDSYNNKLLPGSYDMLASEARLAYFFAIAKKDIKVEIWQKLGRFLTAMKGKALLLSWSGSMFEYLMPPLILREDSKTLLGQTNNLVIKKQQAYGKANKKPWGISEAAFNAFDANWNYQYSNFGVPELGLQRSLAKNYVIAPYASLMAAQFKPKIALKNLRKLANLGAYGKYGFYDAVDFTTSRLPPNTNYAIIKNYYAHHHGMGLVAIYNLLTNNKMQDYFYAEPSIQAFDILLQEKAPSNVPFSNFKNINKAHSNNYAFNEINPRKIDNQTNHTAQFLLLNSANLSLLIDNMANISGPAIKANFFINSQKIGDKNTKVIFSLNKAVFSKYTHEVAIDLTLTPHEFTGYCGEFSLINQSNNFQTIQLQFQLPSNLTIDNKDSALIFNNKHKANFFIPALASDIIKNNEFYYVNYNIKLQPKQKFIQNFWYYEAEIDLTYLKQSDSFENELQKSWLKEQTNLFHNNITLYQAINYQKLLAILMHTHNGAILLTINNKNYLYAVRDILMALSFWQRRGFNCSINIINKADNYHQLEGEINWLKQTYNHLNCSNIKTGLSLHAQNGDVSEQLTFFKLDV